MKTKGKRYIINTDDTVIDTETNLMWWGYLSGEDLNGFETPSSFTWDEAMNYETIFAGYDDWRLPTQGELMSIVKRKSHNNQDARINLKVFPYTPPKVFWTSIVHELYPTMAVGIDFQFGYLNFYPKETRNLVRLVRTIGE